MGIGRFCCAVLVVIFAAAFDSPRAAAQTQPINYDDVIANPDDLRLTLAYAQQEWRAGRLEQAAASLERLLLLQPNWDSVRLFYARVLFREKDYLGARRELEILDARPQSPEHAQEIKRLLSLIDNKEKPFHGSFGITIGGRVDSNAASATNSDVVLSGDNLVPSNADERVDGAFLAAARLRLEYQPSPSSDNDFFLQINGRWRNQIDLDTANFAMARAGVGADLYFEDLKLVPQVYYQPYFLGDDLFLEEYGGSLGAEYDLSSRMTLLGRGELVGQDYHATSDSPLRNGRDGWRGEVGGGFRAKISGTNTFTARAAYLAKEASYDPYGYQGAQVYVSDRQGLGMGQYLLGQFTYWHIGYDEPDPRVTSTVTREDDRFKVRAAYGVPLSTAFKAVSLKVPEEIGLIRLELSGSYYKQNSNIPNFDSENLSGDVTLTRNFSF